MTESELVILDKKYIWITETLRLKPKIIILLTLQDLMEITYQVVLNEQNIDEPLKLTNTITLGVFPCKAYYIRNHNWPMRC